MSDSPSGPGWWQASDGKWYPPESAPGSQGPPQQGPPPGEMPPQGQTPPQAQGQGFQPYQQQQQPYPGGAPEPKPKSKGPLIAILVAVAVVAAAAVGFAIVLAGDDEDTASETTVVDDGEEESESTSTTSDEGGGDDLAIDVPDGFVAFVSEDEGVAIALPTAWEEFDLSDPTVQASLDDFASNNPEMGAALDQAGAMIAAGGVLFALDPTQFPFAPNINIIRSPGEIDLESAQTTVDSQLEGIGAENVTSEIVELPAGEALRIEYDLPLNLADGTTTEVHGVQYQIPAAGSTWAITMTTDDVAANGEQFDQMIETFTVAE